uniref:Uncharacterized protein n=1 Tax=Rhizophora mucronata TaxID=61149 RepID=A0A2P2PUK1_RHIMU
MHFGNTKPFHLFEIEMGFMLYHVQCGFFPLQFCYCISNVGFINQSIVSLNVHDNRLSNWVFFGL